MSNVGSNHPVVHSVVLPVPPGELAAEVAAVPAAVIEALEALPVLINDALRVGSGVGRRAVTIDVINSTSSDAVLPDAECVAVIQAIQHQFSNEFAAAWPQAASYKLNFVPRGQSPVSSHWWVVLLDNSDVAGVLGYHDLTTAGLPMGKVFVQTCKQYNESWTVDLDHELLEMAIDPDVNLTALFQTATTADLYPVEVGDPVQDDSCGYQSVPVEYKGATATVLLSDFVYPAWFESFWGPHQAQFDHTNHLSEPFTLAPGGYAGVLDLNALGQGWTQIYGAASVTTASAAITVAAHASNKRARVGSRRERRTLNKTAWQQSEVFSEGDLF
jgi:hypothetical protein